MTRSMEISKQICILLQLQAAFHRYDLINFFLDDAAEIVNETWLGVMCINPFHGLAPAIADLQCLLNFVSAQDDLFSPLTVFLSDSLFDHFTHLLGTIIDICEETNSLQLLDIMTARIRSLNQNLNHDLQASLRTRDLLTLYDEFPLLCPLV